MTTSFFYVTTNLVVHAFLVERGGDFNNNENSKEDNYDKDNNHNLQVSPSVVVAWEGSLLLDRENGQWRGGLLSEQEGGRQN